MDSTTLAILMSTTFGCGVGVGVIGTLITIIVLVTRKSVKTAG